MRMHSPPHPGEVLQEMYLGPLGLNITDAAKALNMPRAALSEIVNGRRGVSPKVAIKLGKAFGRSPESWLKNQMKYDLWEATQEYDASDVEVCWDSEVESEPQQEPKAVAESS